MDWGVGVLVFIKTQQSLLSWDNDGVGCGCVSVYKNTTKLAKLRWIGVWVY